VGAVPPDSGKAIIFLAKAKFFRQKPTAKMKKKLIFGVLVKQKKTEFILSSEIKA